MSALILFLLLQLDPYPVTIRQFQAFLRDHSEWRRSEVKRIWADERYLLDWTDDLTPPAGANPAAPVTQVSWFAAQAYCEIQGKTLPTVAEWETAAKADETRRDATGDPAFTARILTAYGRPATHRNAVGGGFRTVDGLYDLHGLVWEWTLDFNSVAPIEADGRFCGAGAGGSDPSDYARFLRDALRGSLKPNHSVTSVGFRCAKRPAS